jgi:hypothetical protein
MLLARQDTFSVSVNIDGRDFGIWEGRSGGDTDTDESKVRLGAMGPEVALGGTKSIDDVTCTKIFDIDGIGQEYVWLVARAGNAPMTVVTQPLDRDGHAHGRPWTYTGVLKGVNAPEYDAQSGDAAMIEVIMSVNSVVA